MESHKYAYLPLLLIEQDGIDMGVITPTSLNSTPHSIQIDRKRYETIAAVFLISRLSVTLSKGPGQEYLAPNVEFNNIYHRTKFEPNRFITSSGMPTSVVLLCLLLLLLLFYTTSKPTVILFHPTQK